MTPVTRPLAAIAAMAIFLAGCVPLKQIQEERLAEFREAVRTGQLPFTVPPGSSVDTIVVSDTARSITIRMSREFSHVPYRRDNVRQINSALSAFFEKAYEGYSIAVETLGMPLEELIPNFYRASREEYDLSRLPNVRSPRPEPVLEIISKPLRPTAGLSRRTIGLWHSHGWYYDRAEDRWEWQRPRLFQSVEDLGPMSYTLPYLVPMLENAGAIVFLPRERDTQRHEVVVDNDTPGAAYRETTSGPAWRTGDRPGFATDLPPYAGSHNPFRAGTFREVASDHVASATAIWVPDIPEDGYYYVSVSYSVSEENVSDARYTVIHDGGRTEFSINQQIGGATWQYLGRFKFRKGINPERGRVLLTNESSQPGRLIAADAVRFGGGMGVIARNGMTSGRAKYLEGARYWLQYAGIPDTLVYSLNGDSSDYKDDYMSRPEYLNYLMGTPCGPNKDRTVKGLGIPIDAALAFHTDAGITTNDTVVGTLSIYSIEGKDSARVFPDSVSRLANRDLADLVQTQIVEDIRALYDPAWTRRDLRHADYSESVRPNMPAVLLELLSHQNLTDMKFMLDPRFRFDVSRAIYKALLKFIATQHNTPVVVQPLPITHFAAEFDPRGGVHLSWRSRLDPLEPTAVPEKYIVYTRLNDAGFDNGTLVDTTEVLFTTLRPGEITSYYVTAVNAGGESFPSEILSVCSSLRNDPPVLIVNGFTRVSGPAAVEADGFSGFLSMQDFGVPDRSQLNFTGEQYDFHPASPFRTNDGPGHGASQSDREGSVIAGNTFDYPLIHGAAIRANGLSFVSCSKDAVVDGAVQLGRYRIVDLILGKEREMSWQRPATDSLRGPQFQAFPPKLQAALHAYCEGGGNLFVSGAYIGTDLQGKSQSDTLGTSFGTSTLKLRWLTGHASPTGTVAATRNGLLPDSLRFTFQTSLSPDLYAVESADAIAPTGGATTVLRYTENNFSAGIAFPGSYRVVALGFPFETIQKAETRTLVMNAILGFFAR